MLGEQADGGLLVARVRSHGLVPVAGGRGALGPAEVVVGDDQLGERAAGGDPGQRRADPGRSYRSTRMMPILACKARRANGTSRSHYVTQLKSLPN